jgi:aryl-alcohol dehydrogenase-like predicted oxidoreductase
MTPFVIYQGAWNVMERSFEREIIPMARSEGNNHLVNKADDCLTLKIIILGMALAPWNVLAGGKIRTDEEEERRRQTGEKGRTLALVPTDWERNEKERMVCKALEKIAVEIGTKHITSGIYPPNLYMLLHWLMFHQVAIAYLMQKTPYVFPIVGGRKVEHLMANIEALEITLSNDQIKYLESVVSFEPGFPYWVIVSCHFFFLYSFSMVISRFLICISS